MTDIELWWWLPVAAVLAMTALALLAVSGRPPGWARQGWMLVIVIAGTAAIALTAWQAMAGHAALGRETARLAEIGSRLDQLAKLLPDPPGRHIVAEPPATFETVSDAIHSLHVRIEDLQEQIRLAREAARNRRVDPETASRLAAYLRGAGPYRVVVSAVPGDAEAFGYANQLVNILREAGWDALGPETTTIFGAPPYPGVMLFAPNGVAARAAAALTEGFTRFNIPHRSGIPPREATADSSTVSLFVSGRS